jgi:pimeloyl-ACP methyl ester carboxylesterase
MVIFRKHWVEVLQQSEDELLTILVPRSDVLTVSPSDTPLPRLSHELEQRGCCAMKEEPMSMHAVRVQSSKGPSTSVPPLVLVHGYTAASMNFARNLSGLAEIFGTVYAVDLLGWGLSSRPSVSFQSTQETEAFFVDSLEEWRQANKLDRMILAGHSMGGYLCVAYAEEYPEPLERLILMVPGGVQDDSGPTKNKKSRLSVSSSLWNAGVQLESILRMIPTLLGKKVVNSVFGDYMTKRERQLMTDYMHANLMLPTPAISKLFRTDSTAYQPLCHRIPKLRKELPVHFIYAERDTWMKVDYGLAVQRQCEKDITVCVVKDAGHAINWKHPEEFNAAVAVAADKPVTDTVLLPIMMQQPTNY